MWVVARRVDVACDLLRFFPHLAGDDPEATMSGGLYFMLASRLHAYGGAVTLTMSEHGTGANVPPAPARAPVVAPPPRAAVPPPGLPQPSPRPPAMKSRDGVVIRPAGDVFTLAELGSVDPSTFEVAAVST